jgi:DNA-binding transcriptional ArsR family regulator/ubiquinone/menaquinone biosynthesis C-methylase UbiE
MAADLSADRQALADVIGLGLLWHCLCAITRLQVPEQLAAGPLPVPELAAATGTDRDALYRVLRLLGDHGIVTLEGDLVGLTERGRLVCPDHPQSIHAAFATVGVADVAHALADTLRTGRPAAPAVLGAPYWDYLAAHPDQQALFDEAMRQRATALSLACVPTLDWPAGGTVADVAGGSGTLLAAVLERAPGLRAILIDQPAVLTHARPFLEREGLVGRCDLHPADLFATAPRADLYLLASVLHDWDDEHAARILAAIGRGAGPASRLRIFEMLLPDDATPHRAKMSDVSMLLLFEGARERTAGEYRRLLERTGWRFQRVVASPGPMSVIEASRPQPR